MKDALFLATRALKRLEAPISPYIDEVFSLLFQKPSSDHATFNSSEFTPVVPNICLRNSGPMRSD